jgi:hypothetical protein
MPQSRWFPTRQQVTDDPERVVRQVLTQQYALADRHDALAAKVTTPPAKSTSPPPGSGPIDTQICGLYVTPVDTKNLPAGSVPAYNPVSGQITFTQGATFVAAPLHATSAGIAGQVAYDATHFYVCIAANTWIRATFAGGF